MELLDAAVALDPSSPLRYAAAATAWTGAALGGVPPPGMVEGHPTDGTGGDGEEVATIGPAHPELVHQKQGALVDQLGDVQRTASAARELTGGEMAVFLGDRLRRSSALGPPSFRALSSTVTSLRSTAASRSSSLRVVRFGIAAPASSFHVGLSRSVDLRP